MIAHLWGSAGRLEALWSLPAGAPRAVAALAHPHPLYGGTMHNKVVYHAATALVKTGCAVLRFNFRGVGASEGAWSDGPGERQDYRTALEAAGAAHPDLPIWACGYSFGSWTALVEGAGDSRVAMLLAIAPPVTKYDFTNAAASAKQKVFIQGNHDAVCPLREMRALYARAAEPKELIEIDGADHVFDGKISDLSDAIESLFEDLGRDSVQT